MSLGIIFSSSYGVEALQLLCPSIQSLSSYFIVSHQWCDLFYRLLHSSTRHIEKVEGAEGAEGDTLTVHRNEATVAWPEAIACHRPRRQSGVIKARPPPPHSTFPWTKISDFQEKRLKSMTASF